MLQSVCLINQGDGTFSVRQLPQEAQLSPVYAILIEDLDKDGMQDIVLGGNLHEVKPEIGRYDASYGAFLKGVGNGDFQSVPMQTTGLFLEGQIRDFAMFQMKGKSVLTVARNNAPMQFFEIRKEIK